MASLVYTKSLVFAKPGSTLGEDERQHIGQVINQNLALATLANNSTELTLADVALSGQNIGGIDISSKQLHTVASGETLSGIAAQYDLHSGSIVLANPWLEDTEILQVGEQLLIPPQDASKEELAKEYENRNKKLATTTATAPKTKAAIPTTGKYVSPMNYQYISQGYSSYHRGVDMVGPVGTTVRAAHSGCIVSTDIGWNGGYGRVLVLDHGDGTSSLYAHLSGFILYKGCVAAGTPIAYSGNTGRSTGPHLHFEIRRSGVQINPRNHVH